MAIVYIALGSNLGRRDQNIHEALSLLEKNSIKISKCSTTIETEPVDGPPQGKFLNAVVEGETLLSPYELLRVLQSIEHELGRVRTTKNGPRTIDLDILLYDQLTLTTDELTIPHPRMLTRNFVMMPLNEIAPAVVERLGHARR